MPFNLATAIVVLGGAAHFPRFQLDGISGLSSSLMIDDDAAQPGVPTMELYGSWSVLTQATIRGFGQVRFHFL
jgi:hypothetical protein